MTPTPAAAVKFSSDLAKLMTPTDVSAYLGVPPGTLANWRYLGRGPAFLRVGRHVRYRRADVSARVDRQVRRDGRPTGLEDGRRSSKGLHLSRG